MRDLFSKEFQKEMDDFFDYIDYEVLGKTKTEDNCDNCKKHKAVIEYKGGKYCTWYCGKKS